MQGGGQSFAGAVNDQWHTLARFYSLSLHAYNGNRQAWSREARELARSDGGNPYYRWFLGAGPGQ
ncbi:hypothetical protein D3C76_1840260 [compost metagenome]